MRSNIVAVMLMMVCACSGALHRDVPHADNVARFSLFGCLSRSKWSAKVPNNADLGHVFLSPDKRARTYSHSSGHDCGAITVRVCVRDFLSLVPFAGDCSCWWMNVEFETPPVMFPSPYRLLMILPFTRCLNTHMHTRDQAIRGLFWARLAVAVARLWVPAWCHQVPFWFCACIHVHTCIYKYT